MLDYLDHKRIHLEAVYTYIAFEPLEDLLILADENGRHVTVGKKAATTIKVKKRA